MKNNSFHNNREQLNEEYILFEKSVENVNRFILYGNTVLTSMVICALNELNLLKNRRIHIFERGVFIDEKLTITSEDECLVILCAMRQKVLDSMTEDCRQYFPCVPFFDAYTLFYKWITDCCKRECDYNILADTICSIRSGNVINGLDCIVTTYCNLECRDCSNGIQYQKKEHISTETHINSLNRITEFAPICNCNIQGGEALMYPNLPDVLMQIARNPRIAIITLATNGTILPNDFCMKIMKKCGVLLRVSNYGELSKKMIEIKQNANSNNVPCDAYERARVWSIYGEFYARNRKPKVNKMIAQKCFFGTNDLMLYDNKLFCCCRTLYLFAMGVDDALIKENVLDLREEKGLYRIREIVEGKMLYEICDYCDYPMKEVKPAIQGGIHAK